MLGTKALFPKEALRLDRGAIQGGCSEEQFVREAGHKVALAALEFSPKKVVLLIGKGGKGADAFASGMELLQKGLRVEAFAFFPVKECSPVHQQFRKQFIEKGGLLKEWKNDLQGDLIIDGLFGTGFAGKVEGVCESAIRIANSSKIPIVAIDLPSGVNGTTGKVESVAIQATLTVAIGFAKMGLFLRSGWHHAGRLQVVDFGLPEHFVKEAKGVALLPDEKQFALPPILRTRNKYEAGYLVGFSGCSAFRGAPKLAGLAALRMGAGIVRLFHREEIGEAPYELILQKWSLKRWREEEKRASALFVGPGIGKAALGWLEKTKLPIVMDADALQPATPFPKGAILTPHRGEMARLLKLTKPPFEEELFERVQQFVERHQVILLLKGAPTFIFAHDKLPLIITRGDPGMATAGSGDVLTGIIGGLLAQKMSPYAATAFGAYLHGLAGEIAAFQKSSYSLIASDLIDALPEAIKRVI